MQNLPQGQQLREGVGLNLPRIDCALPSIAFEAICEHLLQLIGVRGDCHRQARSADEDE